MLQTNMAYDGLYGMNTIPCDRTDNKLRLILCQGQRSQCSEKITFHGYWWWVLEKNIPVFSNVLSNAVNEVVVICKKKNLVANSGRNWVNYLGEKRRLMINFMTKRLRSADVNWPSFITSSQLACCSRRTMRRLNNLVIRLHMEVFDRVARFRAIFSDLVIKSDFTIARGHADFL